MLVMPKRPAPPIAAALSFVDAINGGDLDRLTALMSDDHALHVFDEPPVVGVDANRDAWRGYFDGFPAYVIAPEQLAETRNRVAILGHTTGSHLGLPDDEERTQTLIWIVDVVDGQVAAWRLVEDTPTARRDHGLWNAAQI